MTAPGDGLAGRGGAHAPAPSGPAEAERPRVPCDARPSGEGGGDPAPEETLAVFVAALRRRDLAKASACLAPDACFLTPDQTAIHGRAEIVEVLSQLRACAIDLRIEMRAAALRAGDTALTAERWTVRTAGADVAGMVRSFDSRTVLRRSGRHWRIVVLTPWGWR